MARPRGGDGGHATACTDPLDVVKRQARQRANEERARQHAVDIYRRRAAMAPVRDMLHAQGRRHGWLAGTLGLKKARLSRYLTGHARVPRWVIEQSCELLGVSASLVFAAASEAVLIQPPNYRGCKKPVAA